MRLSKLLNFKDNIVLNYDLDRAEKDLKRIWTPDIRHEWIDMKLPDIAPAYDLTVIIPVYNTKEYLDKCICSVLEQETDYTIQLLIVEDHSTDGSDELLRKYERMHLPGKDISLIFLPENRGLANARNTALSRTSGRYVTFLDSDDYLRGRTLIQKLLTALEKEEADFIQMQYLTLENGILKKGSHIPEGVYTDYESMCRIPGYACMKIYRRNLFKGLWFPDNFWFEDTLIHIRIFPRCKKGIVTFNYGYVYLKNPKGITQTRKYLPRSVETVQVLQELLKNTCPYNIMNEILRHLTTISYHRIKDLPEETIVLCFLVSCKIVQALDMAPSTEYREVYQAFMNQNYGYWRWYSRRKK